MVLSAPESPLSHAQQASDFWKEKVAANRMRNFVRTLWRHISFTEVSQMDHEVFLFPFPSSSERDRVLESGPWSFNNRPLVLKPGVAGKSYTLESVSSLPVWVRFPSLGLHLRKPTILGRIASAIGRPIRTDGFTAGNEKLMFARVFIEIFAEHEFKTAVVVRGPNGISTVQKVEYEWLPSRCSHCQSFGHKIVHCKLPRVELEEDDLEIDRAPIDVALDGPGTDPTLTGLEGGDPIVNVEKTVVNVGLEKGVAVTEQLVSESSENDSNNKESQNAIIKNAGQKYVNLAHSSQAESEKDESDGLSSQISAQCYDVVSDAPFVEVKRKSKKKKKSKSSSYDSDMSKNLIKLTKKVMDREGGKKKGGSYKATSSFK